MNGSIPASTVRFSRTTGELGLELFSDGVYRAGMASTQEAYDGAVKEVFDGLDRLESVLEDRQYIVGDQLTEVDIRTWVSLVRSRSFSQCDLFSCVLL